MERRERNKGVDGFVEGYQLVLGKVSLRVLKTTENSRLGPGVSDVASPASYP